MAEAIRRYLKAVAAKQPSNSRDLGELVRVNCKDMANGLHRYWV